MLGWSGHAPPGILWMHGYATLSWLYFEPSCVCVVWLWLFNNVHACMQLIHARGPLHSVILKMYVLSLLWLSICSWSIILCTSTCTSQLDFDSAFIARVREKQAQQKTKNRTVTAHAPPTPMPPDEEQLAQGTLEQTNGSGTRQPFKHQPQKQKSSSEYSPSSDRGAFMNGNTGQSSASFAAAGTLNSGTADESAQFSESSAPPLNLKEVRVYIHTCIGNLYLWYMYFLVYVFNINQFSLCGFCTYSNRSLLYSHYTNLAVHAHTHTYSHTYSLGQCLWAQHWSKQAAGRAGEPGCQGRKIPGGCRKLLRGYRALPLWPQVNHLIV